jgi:hypothetical protein
MKMSIFPGYGAEPRMISASRCAFIPSLPAQSLDTLGRFAVHLIRPTYSILGVGFEIAVLIGNTIGSGILRNPGEVAGRLPSTGPVPQRAQDSGRL